MLGVVYCEKIVENYFIIMVETFYFLTMLLSYNNFVFTIIVHKYCEDLSLFM